MLPAADSWSVGLQEAQRRREIKCAPAATSFTSVIAPAPPAAHPAPIPLSPVRSGRDDHLSLDAHRHILQHRPLQPKQPRPYPDTAHVASPPENPAIKKPETLGGARRAPIPQPFTPPTETSGAPLSAGRSDRVCRRQRH